jgi:hypothetical protein
VRAQLIDERKVFALVAITALDYAGAPQVAKVGVPDIGGQPIGPAYGTHPQLYGIYGSSAPRTGESPGRHGILYGGTEVYRYFKRAQGARTDAATSCAADLTRACVERFLNRPEPYTARGLLLPVSYEKLAEPPKIRHTCLSVAR